MKAICTGVQYKSRFILLALLVTLMAACGGGSSTSSNEITLNSQLVGTAQKGPFIIGTPVVITKLDTSGNLTSEKLNTQVSDKNGHFSFTPPESWNSNLTNNYHINAEGFAIEESTGAQTNQPVKLTALTQSIESISVNVLTHWAALRTRTLLNQSKSFNQSYQQANAELTRLFGISQFNQLDISSQDSQLSADNTMLLLLSGALTETTEKHDVNSQQLIDEIGSDFADDAELNDEGDNWFLRMQALIRDNPKAHVQKYSTLLKEKQDIESTAVDQLPEIIPLASRPVANVPAELFAEPGETIVLDGSASHDSGNIINFTWFRVDQQTQYPVPVSDRFIASPSITVPDDAQVLAAPNQEIALLYALVVTDEEKLTHTGVVKVIIKSSPEVNTPPLADPQQLTTNEDTPLKITLTGSDADGDEIVFNLNTPLSTAHGIIELDPDLGSALPNIVYTPTDNFSGTDSFNFFVNDGFESSIAATVDILINPVNDPPVANPQSVNTPEGVAVDIILTGSDIENDPLTFNLDAVTAQNGEITGTLPNITYTPDLYFTGTDQFNFTVNDGSSTSAPAIVDIQVNGVNLPPDAIATFDATEPFNEGTQVQLRGSESSDDGTIVSFLWEQIGTPLVTLSDPAIADPTFIAPTVVTAPLSLTFRLTVTDDDGATSSDEITISINGRPIAGPVADFTLSGNSTETITLSGSDPEGGALTYKVTSLPTNGFISGVTVDVPFSSPDIFYSPNNLPPEADSLTFTVIDDQGFESAPVTVNLLVGNNAPIAFSLIGDEQVLLNFNVSDSVTFNLEGSDPDGDSFTFEIVEIITPPNAYTFTQGASFTNDGEVTFTVIDFSGAFEFTFKVIDVHGLSSNIATVRIVVF